MPPKKQQKKQLVAIFQPSIFWQYTRSPPQSQQKLQTYLKTFQNQLKPLIQQQKTIYQNYQTLCKKIGLDIHPCLVNRQKQESQYPNLKSNDYGQKYLLFSSHKIDILTFKLLGFLMSNYKINTLKFSNNQLDNQIVELKKFIQKQDQLTSLYLEWNPLRQIQNRNQFFLSLALPNIQHLILRQCEMGNQITINLLNKISQNQTSNLISLDLYGNKLTPQISKQLSKFVEQHKKIQFLGLSKNQLNLPQVLKLLLSSIGQIPLSEQQYQAHKLKQKQREQINQRNKKRKKGAPQQPVPFLLQIKQTQKGRFYVKNTSLKVLNLSSNSIKDSVNKESNVSIIKNFLQHQGKNIQLFLEGNLFLKKSKQMFKFYQNVYF